MNWNIVKRTNAKPPSITLVVKVWTLEVVPVTFDSDILGVGLGKQMCISKCADLKDAKPVNHFLSCNVVNNR